VYRRSKGYRIHGYRISTGVVQVYRGVGVVQVCMVTGGVQGTRL